MFTGLIEELGRVIALEGDDRFVRLRVAGPLVTSDASLGDSIAVNGVCLTATDLPGDGTFACDVMGESMRRTALGRLAAGMPVNLERAMALGDRLGGHVVQGHVDAVAELLGRRDEGEWRVLRFSLPPQAAPLVVEKGSIAVDGVSLTVSAAGEPDLADAWFEVSLIPATLRETTLGTLERGQVVNLETDMLARHVQRILAFGGPASGRDAGAAG